MLHLWAEAEGIERFQNLLQICEHNRGQLVLLCIAAVRAEAQRSRYPYLIEEQRMMEIKEIQTQTGQLVRFSHSLFAKPNFVECVIFILSRCYFIGAHLCIWMLLSQFKPKCFSLAHSGNTSANLTTKKFVLTETDQCTLSQKGFCSDKLLNFPKFVV